MKVYFANEIHIAVFFYSFNNLPPITLNAGEHEEYRWMTYKQSKKLLLTPGIDQTLDILFKHESAN